MAVNKATVTAVTGIGQTVTAQVFSPIIDFRLDMVNKLLFVTTSDGQRHDFDVSGATTYTLTVSSGIFTLTVS